MDILCENMEICALLQAAQNGDATAQSDLGERYYLGNGVIKDWGAAETWLIKAVEQGNVNAQYRLGYCYYYGDMGDSDDSVEYEANYYKGIELLNKAAKQGHIDAMYEVANESLFETNGVVKNYREERIRRLTELAEKGHLESQYSLANIFYYGGYVDKALLDKEKAVLWYTEAAKQGNREAQYMLAECFLNGIGTDKDVIKGREWHAKAAKQGHCEAQFQFAEYYYNGIGINADKALAVEWYKKAALQSHEKAIYKLAECYYYGEGVEEDKKEAVFWYKKVNSAEAEYKIGDCYYYGKGIEMNKEMAIEWYEKAAKNDHSLAQYTLGSLYWEEYNKTRRFWISEKEVQLLVQAYDYFSAARRQGLPAAKEMLDSIFQDRRRKKILYKYGRS